MQKNKRNQTKYSRTKERDDLPVATNWWCKTAIEAPYSQIWTNKSKYEIIGGLRDDDLVSTCREKTLCFETFNRERS